jgi:hypothetical protein
MVPSKNLTCLWLYVFELVIDWSILLLIKRTVSKSNKGLVFDDVLFHCWIIKDYKKCGITVRSVLCDDDSNNSFLVVILRWFIPSLRHLALTLATNRYLKVIELINLERRAPVLI